MTTSLDLAGCPLSGVSLIEASAGTGKTWTLCGLYLRLLIEGRRSVHDILVVTFTTAATAELKERIRSRLAEMQRALDHDTKEASDPFVAAYVEALRDGTCMAVGAGLAGPISATEAQKHITEALHQFDEAAIFTIHGFCQRALSEVPFAAGMPFTFETLQSDASHVHQVATDFYRKHIASGNQDLHLAARLRERLPLKRVTSLLRHRLGKPLDRLDFDVPTSSGSFRRYCEIFEAARTMWQLEHAAVADILREGRSVLHGGVYRAGTVESAFLAVDAFFRDPFAPSIVASRHEKTRYLCAQHIAQHILQKAKSGASIPRHAFFELIAQLRQLDADAEQDLDCIELKLIQSLLTESPERLRTLKRQQRVIAFDDMLLNLRDALRRPGLDWLAGALRQRYPVALIDEFQDTDPLQFEIFSAIYQPVSDQGQTDAAIEAGPLFLIGDPKQAIYGFRGADLFTYLAAAEQAAHRHTLDTNQRSVAPLIDALNVLFTRNPRPFVLDRLDYHAVQASARPKPVFRDDGCNAALLLWHLPNELHSKGRAEQQATQATAAEIARLLRGARAGTIAIGERPLMAGDIAVIVRSHHQGRKVREALLALGIASVERSQDSVYASEQARVLELFLRALAEPGRQRTLNAALASELFGLSATDLATEGADESLLAHRFEQFDHYRALWSQRSFAAMWRQVQLDTRLVQRLLPQPTGERSVTNYIHLGELVHSASAEHAGMDDTLRWLRAMRDDERAPEQAQLRLESDERLVQIATVHAAKGLEYPVTFCPFLWSDGTRQGDEALRASFHDDSLRPVTRYALDNSEAAARQRLEDFAEGVRNLYVALTRGVYRTVLVTGMYAYKQDSGKASTKSTLNWLVAGAGQTPQQWLAESDKASTAETRMHIAGAWQDLKLACGDGGLQVCPLPDAPGQALTAGDDGPAQLSVRRATRRLEPSWSLASFTSLSHAGPDRSNSRELPERDHDELVAQVDTHDNENESESKGNESEEGKNRAETPAHSSAPERAGPLQHDLFAPPAGPTSAPISGSSSSAVVSADNMLLFPRGAEPGTLLHAVFEHADFTDETHWEEAIERALTRHPLTLPPLDAGASAPRLHAMLRSALVQVTQADLDGQGLRLTEVAPDERLNEIAFSFSARRASLPALKQLLANSGVGIPAMQADTLNGYVRGAIDCIFSHRGRYYLADWKSNYLGASKADYSGTSLERAMAAAGYTLQYALYSLALHRYLGLRLRDYDYERDFGGAFYVFVRGVQPGWQQAGGASSGIYHARLDVATMNSLDALFAGAAGPRHELASAHDYA